MVAKLYIRALIKCASSSSLTCFLVTSFKIDQSSRCSCNSWLSKFETEKFLDFSNRTFRSDLILDEICSEYLTNINSCLLDVKYKEMSSASYYDHTSLSLSLYFGLLLYANLDNWHIIDFMECLKILLLAAAVN